MPTLDLTTTNEFHPFSPSRRGEVYAWLFTLIILLVLIFVPDLQGIFLVLGLFFVIFFGISAIMISLNNWMERSTELQINASGLKFRNGLRNVQFIWDKVTRVEVARRATGRRVHVIGEEAHFAFYMQGAVKLGSQVGEQTGFEQGETILETILENTSLTLNTTSQEDVYYYARD